MSRQPYDRGQFQQKNQTEAEIALDHKFDTEEASKSGHNLFKRRRLFDKGTKVTTTYVDSKIFDARFYKDKLVHIINKDDTNNLLYKWLACVNPTKWRELQPETTITPTSPNDDYQTNTEPFAFYKLQVKSSAGSVEVEAYMEAQK